MLLLERSGWLSRRALPRLLFAGVFERHPNLRYVLTEQNGEWWAATMREYDSAYVAYRWQIKEQMPKKPSEYCATNVYIGGSYMAPLEAEMAVRDGYVDNIMWGSDYPHSEGTYQYVDPSEENPTRLALRYTFAGIDFPTTAAMLGDNAIRCYGFDRTALQAIADRIDAPTSAELRKPLEELPTWTGSRAFRTVGPYG
jgi:predicted TIM-barrel fold metal-dependent hydrolase